MAAGRRHASLTTHSLMSCDNCLSRRTFIARGTLVLAGAAALAACGDGQIGATPVNPANPIVPTTGLAVKVSSLPELATVNQLVLIPGSKFAIAAKRTGPATFTAFALSCTHEGTLVNIVSNAFVCPNHKAAFDNDGALTRQPNNGGTAGGPLRRLSAVYDASTDTLTIS